MVSRKTVSRMSRYRRLLQSLRDERRREHLLPPARAPCRRQRRPGAPRPHGDRVLRQPQQGLRRRPPASTASRSFLDGSVRQEVALVGVGNLGSRRPRPLRRQEPGRGDRRGLRHRPRAHRHARSTGCAASTPRGWRPGARPRHRDRRAHGARGGRAGGRRRARARRRQEHHQLRADAAALPNDIFVEYMDITAALESAAFFARLGGRDEPPPTATATSSRWSGNWNPCSRGRT